MANANEKLIYRIVRRYPPTAQELSSHHCPFIAKFFSELLLIPLKDFQLGTHFEIYLGLKRLIRLNRQSGELASGQIETHEQRRAVGAANSLYCQEEYWVENAQCRLYALRHPDLPDTSYYLIFSKQSFQMLWSHAGTGAKVSADVVINRGLLSTFFILDGDVFSLRHFKYFGRSLSSSALMEGCFQCYARTFINRDTYADPDVFFRHFKAKRKKLEKLLAQNMNGGATLEGYYTLLSTLDQRNAQQNGEPNNINANTAPPVPVNIDINKLNEKLAAINSEHGQASLPSTVPSKPKKRALSPKDNSTTRVNASTSSQSPPVSPESASPAGKASETRLEIDSLPVLPAIPKLSLPPADVNQQQQQPPPQQLPQQQQPTVSPLSSSATSLAWSLPSPTSAAGPRSPRLGAAKLQRAVTATEGESGGTALSGSATYSSSSSSQSKAKNSGEATPQQQQGKPTPQHPSNLSQSAREVKSPRLGRSLTDQHDNSSVNSGAKNAFASQAALTQSLDNVGSNIRNAALNRPAPNSTTTSSNPSDNNTALSPRSTQSMNAAEPKRDEAIANVVDANRRTRKTSLSSPPRMVKMQWENRKIQPQQPAQGNPTGGGGVGGGIGGGGSAGAKTEFSREFYIGRESKRKLFPQKTNENIIESQPLSNTNFSNVTNGTTANSTASPTTDNSSSSNDNNKMKKNKALPQQAPRRNLVYEIEENRRRTLLFIAADVRDEINSNLDALANSRASVDANQSKELQSKVDALVRTSISGRTVEDDGAIISLKDIEAIVNEPTTTPSLPTVDSESVPSKDPLATATREEEHDDEPEPDSPASLHSVSVRHRPRPTRQQQPGVSSPASRYQTASGEESLSQFALEADEFFKSADDEEFVTRQSNKTWYGTLLRNAQSKVSVVRGASAGGNYNAQDVMTYLDRYYEDHVQNFSFENVVDRKSAAANAALNSTRASANRDPNNNSSDNNIAEPLERASRDSRFGGRMSKFMISSTSRTSSRDSVNKYLMACAEGDNLEKGNSADDNNETLNDDIISLKLALDSLSSFADDKDEDGLDEIEDEHEEGDTEDWLRLQRLTMELTDMIKHNERTSHELLGSNQGSHHGSRYDSHLNSNSLNAISDDALARAIENISSFDSNEPRSELRVGGEREHFEDEIEIAREPIALRRINSGGARGGERRRVNTNFQKIGELAEQQQQAQLSDSSGAIGEKNPQLSNLKSNATEGGRPTRKKSLSQPPPFARARAEQNASSESNPSNS